MSDDDTSDGDYFKALREYTKRQKRYRLKANTAELLRLKIPFVSKCDGVHLVIAERWDFWPSTGKWFDRVKSKRGHDFQTLLSSITAAYPEIKSCLISIKSPSQAH